MYPLFGTNCLLLFLRLSAFLSRLRQSIVKKQVFFFCPVVFAAVVLGAAVADAVVVAAADVVTAVVDVTEDETLSVTGTALSVVCKTVVCDDVSGAVVALSVTAVV